jgi:hypothetical protein
VSRFISWYLACFDGFDILRVLLATIRDGGVCCCPRCLVKKQDIQYLGLQRDDRTREKDARRFDTSWTYSVESARRFILEKGYNTNSAVVERILKPQSLVPIKVNVFPALDDIVLSLGVLISGLRIHFNQSWVVSDST